MTIQTKTYRVIKITPKQPFSNRWTGLDCKLPPVYRNDELKGKSL